MGKNRGVDRVLLNVDAGELPDEPEELYALAHLVNVACGGHAGDDASMDRVIASCMQSGTLVGAHPSYEDRAGFGRRAVAMEPDALERLVHAQCARLAARAGLGGTTVRAMKPHGALYHAVNADLALARATVAGAGRALGRGAAIVGLAGGELAKAAREAGHEAWAERFADRGVRPDGSLVPRGEPGALVTDPAVAAARAAAIALEGNAHTVCVHGDTPGAADLARAVRRVLDVVAPVQAFGDEAWRWSIAHAADRRALLAALRAMPGARDVVVTEAHACVVGARPDLRLLAPLAEAAAPPRAHTIRVRYDGEDLDEIAAHAGISRELVVALHAAPTYTVSFVGFLPGFAYLREVDARIAVPRRATPRARVAAGAVGIGAGYTGIYPCASPGGWNLVGTAVELPPFDPAGDAALALGDRVRFEPVP
jgi:5-oxoprolinase (ATP-hydrolysing) subunit A